MYDITALGRKLGEMGIGLCYEETLPSTNLYLKEYKPMTPTVCLCENQTAGYGRKGDAWLPGGITFSYVREVDGEYPYSLYCGLAAVRALSETAVSMADEKSPPVLLKWPNDLVSDGKKLGGILCEGYFSGGKRYMVFGVGLNTDGEPETFARAGLPHAASLAMMGLRLSSPEDFIAVLVRHLDGMIAANEAEREALLEEYRRISATIGREVTLSSPEGQWRDRAVDVDKDGRLVLAGGKVILSGEVSVRGIYNYSE